MLLWALGGLPTDLELLRASVRTALSVVPWESLPETLYVWPEEGRGRWDWLVEEGLLDAALRAGKVAKRREGRPSLSYRVGLLRVNYRVLGGPLPWSPKRLERKALVSVSLVAEDTAGAVLWRRDAAAQAADTIPLSEAEGVRVEGLSPKVEEKSSLSEDFVAGLVMAGLLWVFYAFESR